LVRGSINQIPKESLFDVVTLWDVIEHAKEPVGLAECAARHLKKDGWLVIETGNYKSADRILGGLQHWIYQLDHRWYFSPDSLKHMMGKLGFTNYVFSQRVLRPEWNGRIDYRGPSKRAFVADMVRDLAHANRHFSKYNALIRSKSWEMSGMGIFAVAARKAKQ